MVADCTVDGLALRCSRLVSRSCRENDIAVMTVDAPNESLTVARRMIQASDRCVDIGQAIDSVEHPSGLQLSAFRDIRGGTQNGDWVYLCARFRRAAVVVATPTSALERPDEWMVLPIYASCREDEDFVELDGTTYYVQANRAFRINNGTVVAEVGLPQIYGPDAPSRIASYEHANAGDWTLAALGFDQLVLQRRRGGEAWQRLRGSGGEAPANQVPFAMLDDDVIALEQSEVEATRLPGSLVVLPNSESGTIETLQAVGDRVYVGRATLDAGPRVDILNRDLAMIRSFAVPVRANLLRLAPLTDEITIVGTSAGLWSDTSNGVMRLVIEGESQDGWMWQARGGLGGVWGLGNQELHFIRPNPSARGLGVVASRHGPDDVQAFDGPCPSQLVFLDAASDAWVPTTSLGLAANPDRVLTVQRDPTLTTENEFNPDLRGRPIDLVRRGRRAIIATDWNLLVSAGAKVVARAPFRVRRLHVDAQGYVYVEGYQGRLAVSDRPVLMP